MKRARSPFALANAGREKCWKSSAALCGKKLCRAAAAFMERNASMCDEILPRVVVKFLPGQI